MDPLYRPHGVETKWQETWEAEGLYQAEASDPRETFVICLPPPNVTGELHMGHALNTSCQDVLVRWHRMRDYNALWQPGYDHAGIALLALHRPVRRPHRRPAPLPRCLARLPALALHHGRRLHARGHALLRTPVG